MRAQCSANQSYGHNFTHFDTLIKLSPINIQKYVAVHSIMIKEFGKSLKIAKKNHFFFIFCDSIFS